MRLDGEKYVEIACRPAPQSSLALAGQPNARAVFNSGRNIDRQRPLFCDPAGAMAITAWVRYDLPASLAGLAGSLDRKEA
jgi:hypothetical protein